MIPESYAGQYIPTLMDQIHTKGGINLKGAAVGNGVGASFGAGSTEVFCGGCFEVDVLFAGGGPTARGDRIRTKFYYNKG